MSGLPLLTDREHQAARYVVLGLPNYAIAERMGVSYKTVKNTISAVRLKLDLPWSSVHRNDLAKALEARGVTCS